MMKYKGQGGTAPRETTIAGQRHMLAYINPFEYDLLQQYNAAPNVYGPGGVPAYPGNAAAEGGFGLGAGEAFGGGVSSAGGGSAGSSASPGDGPGGSAVGGAMGGFGADFGGNADDAAQAGRYGVPTTGTPSPSNSAASNAALGRSNAAIAEAAAEKAAAQALANQALWGMQAKAKSNLGVGTLSSPNSNINNAKSEIDAVVNAFGTVSPSIAQAIADDYGLTVDQVESLASIAQTQEQVDQAMDRPGYSIGFNVDPVPGLPSLSLDDIDPFSTTGANVVDENGNIVDAATASSALALDTPTLSEMGNLLDMEAMYSTSPAQTQAPGLTQSDMFAVDEAVLDALSQDTTPAMSSANVSTNVSPATVAQDTTQTSTGTTPSSQGKLGQLFSNMKNDIAMGIIAFGKNRATAADAMFAKGYTAEEIGDFFDRTDATVAANAAAAENNIGARDEMATDLDPCPEGFFLDPVSKVCVISSAVSGSGSGSLSGETDTTGTTGTSNWTPTLPEMPTSLPGQGGFTPYTQPALGMATPGLQPYPTGGGLAATPSPNQAGILQMAPAPMQPAPLPNLTMPIGPRMGPGPQLPRFAGGTG